MKLFKRNKIEDEWIVQTKNKIYREIYFLVVIISVISLLIKDIILDLEPTNFITELLILLVATFYYFYRSIYLGIYSAEVELKERKRKGPTRNNILKYSLLFGLGLSLILGLNSAIQYGEGFSQRIEYFLITLIASLIFYVPIVLITVYFSIKFAKRKSEKIMNEMIDEDLEDD